MTPKPPNILLILTDEQHLQTLGCYGNDLIQTPNVDALAREGMRFDHAFCCASICSPSRAALFTGLLPHRFGHVANNLTIPAGTPNLASLLSRQGYRLGYSGKWHIDKLTVPTSHHFEGKDFPGYGYPDWMYRSEIDPAAMQRKKNYYYEYLMENGYEVPKLERAQRVFDPHRGIVFHGCQTGPVESSSTWFVADEAVRHIRGMSARRERDGLPWFTWVNFWGPHNPCYVPEPYFSMYDPGAIPQPPSFEETFAGKPTVQLRSCKYWGMHGAPWSLWQEHLARYWGYCSFIDDQVGRMLSALEAAGQRENTIVMFGSDHGDMMGRHQLMDKGPYMYDDTYRVPLVVAGPGIQHGTCREFVYLHDLFPTILEMGGSTDLPPHDAASLTPLLSGSDGWDSRDEVFGEFDHQIYMSPQRMVRTRTHKFVFNPADVCELYDLAIDPDEMHNRIDDPAYSSIKTDLKARLLAHLKSTRDPLSGNLATLLSEL